LGREPIDLISDGGRRARSIIDEAQARLKPYILVTNALDKQDLDAYRNHSTHLFISGHYFSPQVWFGNLGNPQKPCEIILMEVRQKYPIVDGYWSVATPDGTRLIYGRELLFGKATAIELLSQVKPGGTAKVRGRGRYRQHSKIQSLNDHLACEEAVNYSFSHRVRFALELSLSEDSGRVDFRFTIGKTTQELTFEKGRLLKLPKYSHRIIPRNQ